MEHHHRTPYMETFCGSVEVETGCLTSECSGEEVNQYIEYGWEEDVYQNMEYTHTHARTHTQLHNFFSYQYTTYCRLLPSIGTTKHFAASSCKEIRSAMSNDYHSPPTSGTFSVNVTDPCGGHVRHMKVGTVLYCMNCM